MTDIKTLRNQIDVIDAQIIKKISQRNKVSQKIGLLKSKIQKQILDTKREEEIKSLHKIAAEANQVDLSLVAKIFNLIVTHSRRLQKKR